MTTITAGAAALVVVSLLWAFVPTTRLRSRHRLVTGLFVANIAMAIIASQAIRGVVGTVMSACFLAAAGWFFYVDLKLWKATRADLHV